MVNLKILTFLIAIILFGAIIYFSNITKVIEVLSKSNVYFIVLALISGVILIVLKSFRWKFMLTFINVHASFYNAFSSFNAALFLGNITPGRLLEPIRGYLLKLKMKCSFSETTLLVVAERVIDILIYIVFSIITIEIVKTQLPENIARISLITLSAAFVISVIGLFVLNSKKFTLKFFTLISKFPIVKKFRNKISSFSKKFSSAFYKIMSVKKLTLTLVITCIIWIFEGLVLYFALLSIGIQLSILVCIGFVCLSILIGLLSFLPGGLGSTEVVLILLISSLNISLPESTAAVIVYRFISYLMQNLIGLFFLMQAYNFETLSKLLSKK